jgi:hypothetical protein
MARLEVIREALAARVPPEEIQAVVATATGGGLDGGQEGSEIRVSPHEERSPEMSNGDIAGQNRHIIPQSWGHRRPRKRRRGQPFLWR